MKVIITNIGNITPQLTRVYLYDIVDDNDLVIMQNQSIDVQPSDAVAQIKNKLELFRQQYEIDELKVGMEIE